MCSAGVLDSVTTRVGLARLNESYAAWVPARVQEAVHAARRRARTT
ncbi:MAG: hypothetical protein IPM45_14665 [Acidimicrobiales bacterium]|nr:hypothetical protein [Acidimicrobiales bacterium]